MGCFLGVLYKVRVWDFTIENLGKGTWDRGLVDFRGVKKFREQ